MVYYQGRDPEIAIIDDTNTTSYQVNPAKDGTPVRVEEYADLLSSQTCTERAIILKGIP